MFNGVEMKNGENEAEYIKRVLDEMNIISNVEEIKNIIHKHEEEKKPKKELFKKKEINDDSSDTDETISDCSSSDDDTDETISDSDSELNDEQLNRLGLTYFKRVMLGTYDCSMEEHDDAVRWFNNKYGTEECKQEVFPKLTSGEWFLGIATTESEAGSDVGGTITTIENKGDKFVVNGEKMYISGVREAVTYGGGHVTIAHQNKAKGTRGMTCFYLPLTVKGILPTYLNDLGREGISCGGFAIDNVEIPKHYQP